MDISTTSSLTNTATGTQLAEAKSRISSDFDTFLKMLTAQIQNQDPLNPIDSADYAVQLATFSSVEQQTKTNQSLDALNAQFSMMGMTQLAAWVGNEARSAAPVYFDGAEVTVVPEASPQADRTILVAKDQSGTVVSREDIPPGTTSWQWQGMSVTGAQLPSGSYTLYTENYNDEQLLGNGAVESYARILEVQSGAAGNQLILKGGVSVSAGDITALRGVS